MPHSHYLVVILGPANVTMEVGDRLPEIIPTPRGGSAYKLTVMDDPDYTGFVDWLRRKGQIVGLRLSPFGLFDLFLDALRQRSYARVTVNNQLVLLFTKDEQYDEAYSGDQAFGETPIYATPTGDYYGLALRLPEDFDLPAFQRMKFRADFLLRSSGEGISGIQ